MSTEGAKFAVATTWALGDSSCPICPFVTGGDNPNNYSWRIKNKTASLSPTGPWIPSWEDNVTTCIHISFYDVLGGFTDIPTDLTNYGNDYPIYIINIDRITPIIGVPSILTYNYYRAQGTVTDPENIGVAPWYTFSGSYSGGGFQLLHGDGSPWDNVTHVCQSIELPTSYYNGTRQFTGYTSYGSDGSAPTPHYIDNYSHWTVVPDEMWATGIGASIGINFCGGWTQIEIHEYAGYEGSEPWSWTELWEYIVS